MKKDDFWASLLGQFVGPIGIVAAGFSIWLAFNERAACLATGLYCLNLGISSKTKTQKVWGAIALVALCLGYGRASSETNEFTYMSIWWGFALAVQVTLHFIERYRRHWVEDDEYILLNWPSRGDSK
ncbi:hypothetical protein JYT72_03090 [Crocinitomix catalasitica]|nr:hypothetical protein [Crocinitomix catalasitica]